MNDTKVNIIVHDAQQTQLGWEREAYITGPDTKSYTLLMQYLGEWEGYSETRWLNEDGDEIEAPEWAAELDDYDLDELTGSDII